MWLTRPRVPHREGRACASLRRGIAGGLRGDTSRTDFAHLEDELAASHTRSPLISSRTEQGAQPPSHKGGHFALFSGDCRNSQPRWRMTQSCANLSPRENSLIIRERTGNIAVLGDFARLSGPRSPRGSGSFLPNSLLIRTGNFDGTSGK